MIDLAARITRELEITLMNRNLRTLAAISIVLSLIAADDLRAGGLPRGDARAEGFAPEALNKIGALLEDAVAKRQIAGGAALIARHGKVVYLGTAGRRDAEEDRPVDESTIYRIASMTKPITSTAVMMLVDQGKLKLDEPVSRYIPEFRAPRVLVAGGGVAVSTVPARRNHDRRPTHAHVGHLVQVLRPAGAWKAVR